MSYLSKLIFNILLAGLFYSCAYHGDHSAGIATQSVIRLKSSTELLTELEDEDIKRINETIEKKLEGIPPEEYLNKLSEWSLIGDLDATYTVGWMFLNGVHFDKNETAGLLLIGRAASLGHGRALNKLSQIYTNEIVTSENEQTAVFLAPFTYCYTSLASGFGEQSAKARLVKMEEDYKNFIPQEVMLEWQKMKIKKHSIIIENKKRNIHPERCHMITDEDVEEAVRLYEMLRKSKGWNLGQVDD